MTGDTHDDGFIAGVEGAMFALVLLTLLATVSELFGVLEAHAAVLRAGQLVAADAADSRNSDATADLLADAAFTVDLTIDDSPCPVVTVVARHTYVGVVTKREYLLRAVATRPLTLYRDFAPHDRAGGNC